MQAVVSFLPNNSHFGISAALLAAPDRRESDVQGSIKWKFSFGLFVSWMLDSVQVIIQNISHLQTIYNHIINNVFPVTHFTVQESSIQHVEIF